MTIEIELKLAVMPSAIDLLTRRLTECQGQHMSPQHLDNIYFETEDNFLRRHDMGLRIRGKDGRYEMTMKTAGRVVAGLHQRPEYNVDIDSAQLTLARFPSDIWPEGCDIEALQNALISRFSTNFSRETWLVNHGNSEIEVALDRGEISSGEKREALCEVELELKQGKVEDILAFADWLVQMDGLRMESLSKAARGYALAKGVQATAITDFSVLELSPKATLEEGLGEAIEKILNYWQQNERLWLNGVPQAKLQLLQAMGLLRQIWGLYSGILPRKATHDLREKLTELEVRTKETKDAEILCYSAIYQQMKLAIMHWQILKTWQPYLDKNDAARMTSSFKRFADVMLSRLTAEVKAAFSHELSPQHALQQLPRLEKYLASLCLLSGAYKAASRETYIKHWQLLEQAIRYHNQAQFEPCRRQAVSQPVFWLNSGQVK